MSWTIPDTPASFFTIEERAGLACLFDAIFPGDSSSGVPTIAQANAVDFLDRLLSCDATVYREIPAWQTLYRDGLIVLEQVARQRFQSTLAALSRSQATELLQALEQARLNILLDQPALFRTLRSHCLQGCFSDPGWGGNADKVMWRWFGYRTAPEDIQ